MTMDDNIPESQGTPDPAGAQDFDDTATTPSTTEPPASRADGIAPKRRGALARPWTWVGIAAAGLMLGGGIFATGVVAGKTLGEQHESDREYEVDKAQSAQSDTSEGDESKSEPNTSEMTAPAPGVAVSTPPAGSPPSPTRASTR